MIFDGDSKTSENWILNSACTFHMNPNKDWYSTYKVVSRGTMVMR